MKRTYAAAGQIQHGNEHWKKVVFVLGFFLGDFFFWIMMRFWVSIDDEAVKGLMYIAVI